MAQSIRSSSPERSSLAPVQTAPATVAATPPSVHVRPQQVASFIVVTKRCEEPGHFDEILSTHPGQTIHTLNLQASDMTGPMWKFLLDFLENKPASNTLNLSHCILAGGDPFKLKIFNMFMVQLKSMPSRLILRNCYIKSLFLGPIAKRLEVDHQLQFLDLAENCVRPQHIQLLADALQHNQTFSGLNLARNKFDTAAVPALKNLLENAKSLQELDLSDNLFTPDDTAALFQANAARAGIPVALVL